MVLVLAVVVLRLLPMVIHSFMWVAMLLLEVITLWKSTIRLAAKCLALVVARKTETEHGKEQAYTTLML